ncbi:hypothetical protein [Bradyrhizobium sp. SBR1B]|uniref:hypothetical protein n=1 Tax=Bradyrhizobium sp. SBR1B TaxID=2663836 RepID=UPI001606B055|nr:hypothetical protein [Bradyrhizobium sp. SBR1B]MBB4377067.1 hypothetical protein [Bradyrhizobium sp. SBR1B]
METRIVDTIPEWRYHAEVIARLHALEDAGLPITCAGDMNRAKRSRRERMEAKVTGLTAGEPDVRVYITGGFLLSIELKTPKGSRSKAQKERHPKLPERRRLHHGLGGHPRRPHRDRVVRLGSGR